MERKAIQVKTVSTALWTFIIILTVAVCMKPAKGPTTSPLPPYNLPDGRFTGSAAEELMGKQVAATVVLTLKKGRIITVEVIEGVSLIAGVDSLIPARILQYQTPHVETVTGATASADIVMKAARNALLEARKKRESK